MVRRVRALASEVGAELVVLDPALPLGLIGPNLGLPYAPVLHGAEVTVPGRLPVTRRLLGRVLREASLVIAAGGYAESEARRVESQLPTIVRIPPGVDTSRFVPLPAIERASTRTHLGLPATGPLVLSVSRLVPRKGMDVLIEAAARLREGGRPDLTVAIAGSGRDRGRLERLIARRNAPVRLLGRVPDPDLPGLYASADVFVLACRSRWAGLEQEGFGIVFLEAAAAGVASIAGDSGGAAEAVLAGETGEVLRHPDDPAALARVLGRVIDDPEIPRRQGQAARGRAVAEFAYDVLAERLRAALDGFPRR